MIQRLSTGAAPFPRGREIKVADPATFWREFAFSRCTCFVVNMYTQSSVARIPLIVVSNVMFCEFTPVKSYAFCGLFVVIGAEI